MEASKNDDGNGKFKALSSTSKILFFKYKRPLFCVFGVAIMNLATCTYSYITAPPNGELLLVADPDPSLRGSDNTPVSLVSAPAVKVSKNEGYNPYSPQYKAEGPGGAATSFHFPEPKQEAPVISNILPPSMLDENNIKVPSSAENIVINPNIGIQDPNNAYAGIVIPENNIQGPVNAEAPLALTESNQQTEPSVIEMPERTQKGNEDSQQPIKGPVNDNILPVQEPNPRVYVDGVPQHTQQEPANGQLNDNISPLPEPDLQVNSNAVPQLITPEESNQQGPEKAAPPFAETRSSLQGTNEYDVPHQKAEPPVKEEIEIPRTPDDLRYLTLGSSVTWGAGMEARHFAYPYQLSKDRTHISNLAVRAAGPKYPSVCIQSMVSEVASNPNFSEDYDVIILEYYMRGYDGLYELAQRLRRRYPDAIIILLRLWQPVHILWYENNEMKGTLQDWAIPRKFFLESNTIAQAVKNTKVDLRWPDPTSHNAVQNKIVKDFGAHLYEIDKPRDPRDAIIKYRNRYAQDFNHLNERGHQVVAEEIKKIIERELPSYPKQPRRGDWGDGDSCHSWYQSGVVSLQYSLNVVIEEYDTTNGKFALSTGLSNPSGHGWVIIENPFDTPRNLILSYLATGPPPSIYPKTEITVHPENDEANILSQMVLNPVTTDYEHKVHIVLTTKVSVVLPGRSVVKWRPLENTGKPFRLTATAVVGRDVEEGGILGAIKDFTFFG